MPMRKAVRRLQKFRLFVARAEIEKREAMPERQPLDMIIDRFAKEKLEAGKGRHD